MNYISNPEKDFFENGGKGSGKEKNHNYNNNYDSCNNNNNYKDTSYPDDEDKKYLKENNRYQGTNYSFLDDSHHNHNGDKDANIFISKDSYNSTASRENAEKNAKLIRFAVDYCRASPNISLKVQELLAIGWRGNKYNFDVNYELINYNGERVSVNIFFYKYNFSFLV
jgi:hypothetical protein